MDKDAFMKLLVVQLQNQDPTSETQDPNAMVQMMTSFSQLEQIQNLGTLLTGLQEQNVALFQAQSTGLVGKTVRVQNAPVEVKDGAGAFGLDLAGNAKVTMVVKDEAGRTIASRDLGGYTKGHHDIDLTDIVDSNGNQIADGSYFISYLAFDDSGNVVDAESTSDLVVESVAFADKSVLIVAGGKYYSLGEVIEVRA
jgi:flagellar basal-body rod modification protein FlgD